MADLLSTPLQGAQYLHISPPFSAEDVFRLQTEIARLVESSTPGAWEPRLVFEPTPPSCHIGQRTWLESVTPGLHVLSPNHEELLNFYAYPKMAYTDPRLVTSLEKVMLHLLHQVGVGKNGNGILAVRCGRLGACIGTKKGGLRWFPAYYTGEEEKLVKDVTGGEFGCPFRIEWKTDM
jgi:sugar/nucleoside kinase (ribokinase family)